MYTIVNPMSGETVTFLETAEEPNGLRMVMQIEVAPGGGPLPHAHRHQTEVFEGFAGAVELQLGKRRIMLTPGVSVVAVSVSSSGSRAPAGHTGAGGRPDAGPSTA